MHRPLFRCLLPVWLLLCAVPLRAQLRASVPSRVPPDLRQVARQAGIIFAGKVVSIEPLRLADSDHVASVQITFQVEQGVRGVRAGEQLTFREWAGLWSGSERYRVGQRMMLFLYAPSALGLTSPVGGPAGRMPVDQNGRILLTLAQQQSLQASRAPARIDNGRHLSLRDFVHAIRRMGEE